MRNLAAPLVGAILFAAGLAHAQTTVTGNLKDAGLSAVTSSNSFARFTLKNYASNIPRVTGSGLIVTVVKDFTPDSGGAISGTIAGNDVITPANTFWQVCLYDGARLFRCADYTITGSSFNLNSATPITTVPTPTTDVLGTRVFVCDVAPAATTWTCAHNLNDANVVATFFDGASPRQQIFPDTVKLTNANTLTATFTVAQAGRAIIIDAGNIALASGGVSLSDVVVKNPTAGQTIATQDLTLGARLLPSATGQDVGAAGQRWDIIAQTLDVAGTSTFTGTISSALTPTTNIAYDLGAAAARWRDAYLATARLGADLPTTGAVRLDNNTYLYSKEVTSGSSNVLVIGLNTSNEVQIGNANLGGSDAVSLAPIGTTRINSLRIGSGGTALSKYLSATASLDFDFSGAGITCQDFTIAVTGAVTTDSVSFGGVPGNTGVLWWAGVTSANTVTVRGCDVDSSNPNPGPTTVRVSVWQH